MGEGETVTTFQQNRSAPPPLHIGAVLVAMLIVAMISLHCGAAPKTDTGTDPQETLRFLIPDLPRSLDWTTKTWTGDDIPYKKIEADVDAEFGPGGNVDGTGGAVSVKNIDAKREGNVVTRRRSAALQSLKSLNDRRLVFAWAYAEAEKTFRQNLPFADDSALRALAAVDPMNTYEYTRLRFLLTQYAYQNSDHDDLKALGERLLARRPDDLTVKVAHVYNLCSKRSVRFAQAFTEDWARKEPTNDSPHLLLAFVYQEQMILNKGQAHADLTAPPNQAYIKIAQDYADKSIAEYRAYLKYAAPDAPSRKSAAYLITATEKIKEDVLPSPSKP